MSPSTHIKLRKGKAAMPSARGDNRFLTLKDGDAVTFAPLVDLDDLVSFDQVVVWVESGQSPTWPYLGKEDPSNKLGIQPRYRAHLPVLTKEGEVKMFAFGVSIARQLSEIAEEIGSIKGKLFRAKRQGSGLSTKYTIVSIGREVDVSGRDIPDGADQSYTGPQTLEEVLELLSNAGISLESDASKTVAKAPSKSAAAKDGETDWDSIG